MNVIQIQMKHYALLNMVWALNVIVQGLRILVIIEALDLEFPESTRGRTAGSVLGANHPTS